MPHSRLLSLLENSPVPEVAKLVAANPSLRHELGIRDHEISHTGVVCPVSQEEIVVPCTLTACVYHSDLGRCHGCALVYAHHHGEDFGIVDLAILYRKPVAVMQTVIDRAVAKLRTEMHEDKEVSFEFVPLAGVCTCCESPIDEELVRVHDLDYCSDACATRLPPESARLGYLPVTP